MKNIHGFDRSSRIRSAGWKLLAFAALQILSIVAPGSLAQAAALAPEEILVRMEQRFLQQVHALESYQDQRRYSVHHRLLGNSTYWLVAENYAAPGEKSFEVLERGGSGAVQKRVFARLLEVEKETARASVRPDVDLSRNNYEFKYLGFDQTANAYKFQASPRGANEYLLRGTIWVNAEDFAVQRIEGEPATRHSVLIKRVHFVHEFARFGDMWFPVRHRSETELRLFGTATLDIKYSDYRWTVSDRAAGARSAPQLASASTRNTNTTRRRQQ
ncbi:MAG: hypothetical protein HYX72_09835 [Acidobacteria bacterium]|nr:hypothetical protein [Acidobacteriota bacterium]